MAAPYSTAVYPYPEAMWDEAAEVLAVERGWDTVLIVCPSDAQAKADAHAAMAARGLPDASVVITPLVLSSSWTIRISTLAKPDPRWDDVEDHLENHATAALVVIDTGTVNAAEMVDEARVAMAERGFTVSVGYADDPLTRQGLLRIERV